MNRNFRLIIILLAVLATLAVLSACQTKNKSQRVEKEKLSQASTVSVSQESTLSASTAKVSAVKNTTAEAFENEDTFSADSLKEDKAGNKTYYGVKGTSKSKGNKQTAKEESTNERAKVDFKQSSKKDSTGTLDRESKSKIDDKKVSDNLTGKALSIGLLLALGLVALWCIRGQVKG